MWSYTGTEFRFSAELVSVDYYSDLGGPNRPVPVCEGCNVWSRIVINYNLEFFVDYMSRLDIGVDMKLFIAGREYRSHKTANIHQYGSGIVLETNHIPVSVEGLSPGRTIDTQVRIFCIRFTMHYLGADGDADVYVVARANPSDITVIDYKLYNES